MSVAAKTTKTTETTKTTPHTLNLCCIISHCDQHRVCIVLLSKKPVCLTRCCHLTRSELPKPTRQTLTSLFLRISSNTDLGVLSHSAEPAQILWIFYLSGELQREQVQFNAQNRPVLLLLMCHSCVAIMHLDFSFKSSASQCHY